MLHSHPSKILHPTLNNPHCTYVRLIVNFSHRVDMLRPLSQVEIIPMPYVTEATKVNIILPVTVHEAEALSKFLAVYEKVLFKFHPCHPSDGLFLELPGNKRKCFTYHYFCLWC